jgi:Uri superfamily endonuclease
MFADLTHQPGSYALILHLGQEYRGRVGALGLVVFPAGWYIYCGSAQGGIMGRVGRHLRPHRRHWHIDALLEEARVVAVWSAVGEKRRECAWAEALEHLPGARRPVRGFGSSDCGCAGHLVFLPQEPPANLLAAVWPEAHETILSQ